MPKFAIFFNLAPQAISRMMDNPSDRAAVVGEMLASQGGRLEAYYWMLGQWDGMVIADVPDTATAAAAALAVSSTGAFRSVETHELFESGQLNDLLQAASRARGGYRAPGG